MMAMVMKDGKWMYTIIIICSCGRRGVEVAVVTGGGGGRDDVLALGCDNGDSKVYTSTGVRRGEGIRRAAPVTPTQTGEGGARVQVASKLALLRKLIEHRNSLALSNQPRGTSDKTNR